MAARFLRRIITAVTLGISPAALAQADLPTEPRELDLLLGFRGVGEVWQDPSIIHHYRSSNFGGTGFGSLGVLPWLSVELELGYVRQASNTGRSDVAAGALELAPITFGAVARKDTDRAELFGGLGYAMAVFTEQTDVGTVSGVKPGFDLRTGVRIHTNFVQTSIRPNSAPGIQGMDVEVMFGRRQHHAFGVGSGFDLSAWRAGIGLVARL